MSTLPPKNVLTPPIPPDVMADFEAVTAAIAAGVDPDPALLARVRERADLNREAIFRRHGVLDIGVPAIRAARDGDE
jgi:hypothetical protein